MKLFLSLDLLFCFTPLCFCMFWRPFKRLSLDCENFGSISLADPRRPLDNNSPNTKLYSLHVARLLHLRLIQHKIFEDKMGFPRRLKHSLQQNLKLLSQWVAAPQTRNLRVRLLCHLRQGRWQMNLSFGFSN